MPIGHNQLKLGALVAASWVLGSIPFLSATYTFFHIYDGLNAGRGGGVGSSTKQNNNNNFYFLLPPLLPLYCYLEAAFYVFFLLQRIRLQKPNPMPSFKSSAERMVLLHKIMACMDGSFAFKEWASGWFLWKWNERQVKPNEFGLLGVENFKDW
jgi:hypothetical protein